MNVTIAFENLINYATKQGGSLKISSSRVFRGWGGAFK